MSEIKESEAGKPSSHREGVLKRIFHKFATAVRKGVSLGLVLFFALVTLSFLNHGTDWVGFWFKERATPVHKILGSPALPRVTGGGVSLYAKPAGAAEPARKVGDALRESSTLMDASERFLRQFERLARLSR